MSEFTLEQHFAGKHPAVRELYDRLMDAIRGFGPVRDAPKKTCIHLVHRSALGGITVRREQLTLEFKSDHPIESARLAKSEQVSRGRYHHTLKLAPTDALDGELLGWLKEAYDLSA
jgi:hypothetical protein